LAGQSVRLRRAAAARRREIDVVLVWRLDRWGRSVTDLLATLQELEHLGVGFPPGEQKMFKGHGQVSEARSSSVASHNGC
jgi:DNA invertase Pin-like site-specific DNA recombinase